MNAFVSLMKFFFRIGSRTFPISRRIVCVRVCVCVTLQAAAAVVAAAAAAVVSSFHSPKVTYGAKQSVPSA